MQSYTRTVLPDRDKCTYKHQDERKLVFYTNLSKLPITIIDIVISYDYVFKGQIVFTTKEHTSKINHILKLSDDTIVTVADEGDIKLWDPSTGNEILKISAITDNRISAIVISHDYKCDTVSDIIICNYFNYRVMNSTTVVYNRFGECLNKINNIGIVHNLTPIGNSIIIGSAHGINNRNSILRLWQPQNKSDTEIIIGSDNITVAMKNKHVITVIDKCKFVLACSDGYIRFFDINNITIINNIENVSIIDVRNIEPYLQIRRNEPENKSTDISVNTDLGADTYNMTDVQNGIKECAVCPILLKDNVLLFASNISHYHIMNIMHICNVMPHLVWYNMKNGDIQEVKIEDNVKKILPISEDICIITLTSIYEYDTQQVWNVITKELLYIIPHMQDTKFISCSGILADNRLISSYDNETLTLHDLESKESIDTIPFVTLHLTSQILDEVKCDENREDINNLSESYHMSGLNYTATPIILQDSKFVVAILNSIQMWC